MANKSSVKAAYWLAEKKLFPASKISLTLFTHLFCGFATANRPTFTVKFPPPEEPFTTFSGLVKQKQPDMKTILSIGGEKFEVPSSAASRMEFINSSIDLARNNGFDGLDLCWMYPSNQSEMENLATLLVEWRAAIIKEAESKQVAPLLLTAAAYFSPKKGEFSYPVDEMRKNLDWVNVIAYDLTDPTKSQLATAAPAPLFNPGGGPSVSVGVKEWLTNKLPASKLVLGLPFFGYAWLLENDPQEFDIYAPAEGPYYPPAPPNGRRTYREITRLVDFTQVYEPNFVTDYCYRDRMWVGYSGQGSIKGKVSYAKKAELLGYFGWTLGWDSENCDLAAKAFNTWG